MTTQKPLSVCDVVIYPKAFKQNKNTEKNGNVEAYSWKKNMEILQDLPQLSQTLCNTQQNVTLCDQTTQSKSKR
jgi:hypothetical protein